MKRISIEEASKMSIEASNKLFIKNQKEIFLRNIEANLKHHRRGHVLGVLSNFLKGKNIPVLIVAAGPSLDNQIEHLKMFKGHAIILVVDIAFKAAMKHGLVPDFVVSCDASPIVAEFLDHPASVDIPLIVATHQDPKVIEVWKGPLYWYQSLMSPADADVEAVQNTYPLRTFSRAWASVSGMSLGFAIDWGASCAIVAGWDCSFPALETVTPGDLEKRRFKYYAECINPEPREFARHEVFQIADFDNLFTTTEMGLIQAKVLQALAQKIKVYSFSTWPLLKFKGVIYIDLEKAKRFIGPFIGLKKLLKKQHRSFERRMRCQIRN